METGNGLATGAAGEPDQVLAEEARWRQVWGEEDAFAPASPVRTPSWSSRGAARAATR